MKPIYKLKDYFFDNCFSIKIYPGKVNIINFTNIEEFEEKSVIVEHKDGIVIISGEDLTVSKLLQDEILILGKVLKLEFR